MSPETPPRLAVIDVARGAAVLAMIGYHLAWDLSHLRLIATDVGADPVWRWIARAIAGSFLMLAGIGLVLAHGRAFRPRAFLVRLAWVGGAALLVTAGTWFAFRETFIFYGILHSIAVSSVLALPFLRLPVAAALAAAAFALAAPSLLTSPALDGGVLDVLGLGIVEPRTNDYVPVFPWLAPVLLGVALGRLGLARLKTSALGAWTPRGLLSRAVAFMGRHSLPIYLTHQIVLFGALSLLVQVTGPSPAAERADLFSACRSICAAKGREPAQCERACGCVVERSAREGLMRAVRGDGGTPDQQSRIKAVAEECFR